jgi:hypothetical protein
MNGNITESVTTYLSAGPSSVETMASPSVSPESGDVTLVWSSVEGGTYKVEASNNLQSWTTISAAKAADANNTKTLYKESGAALSSSKRFYRITRTGLGTYDVLTGQ